MSGLITLVEADPTWRGQGLCAGKTELFFAPPRERPGRRRAREATARAYCAVCPVTEECRSWARSNRENGLWGGENDEERAAAGYPPRAIERRSVVDAAAMGLSQAG